MPREKLGKYPRTFLGENAVRDDDFVIQPRIRSDVVQRSRRATLRVRRSKDDSVDARLLQSSRAHHARLERDVERATAEAPITHRARRSTQCENLGVSGGIAAQLAFVVRPGNDATFAHDHRSDGNVSVLHRQMRFGQGFAHREHVIHGFHSTCAAGNDLARSVRWKP
jgi:hypothetical protein